MSSSRSQPSADQSSLRSLSTSDAEPSAVGSDLYQRLVLPDESHGGIMRKVYAGTPWIKDIFTGPVSNFDRYREITEWCRERCGDEAWPLHGRPGRWYCGSATVFGWTWLAFADEADMIACAEAWPTPEEHRAPAKAGTTERQPEPREEPLSKDTRP